jgi:hypothetical protein
MYNSLHTGAHLPMTLPPLCCGISAEQELYRRDAVKRPRV